MSPSRVALIGVGSALVATWLTAATMTREADTSGAAPAAAQRAVAPSAASLGLAAQVERLRARLGDAPVPHRAGRNPFQISTPTVPPRPRPAVALEPGSTPAAPAAFAVTLAGIAEDQTPDGLVRTAIVSIAGQVMLVGEGDDVGARFVVERIGSAGVELREHEDGTVRELALP